ncbi:hypothetical protein [Nocardia terpenica]|uniref:hypothetical protein n=1 Tax=Nocardia terpenica TaxID=455432 RepID=UPI001E52EF3B|nr:hypothetical protein [Nocardia terpenica]
MTSVLAIAAAVWPAARRRLLTIAASVAATVQVYRIGESGAGAAWSGVAARPARTSHRD